MCVGMCVCVCVEEVEVILCTMMYVSTIMHKHKYMIANVCIYVYIYRYICRCTYVCVYGCAGARVWGCTLVRCVCVGLWGDFLAMAFADGPWRHQLLPKVCSKQQPLQMSGPLLNRREGRAC